MFHDSDFGAQTPSRSSLGLHPLHIPLNSESTSLTHVTSRSRAWQHSIPTGLMPAVPFFHLQPCSAPLSKTSHSSLSRARGWPMQTS